MPPSRHHRYLDGLGGWLILVMLGMIFTPIGIGVTMARLYPTIFHLERWQQLTMPGNATYHPLWMPILLFELVYNALVIVLCIFVTVLFFQKRYVWPRCYIALLVLIVAGLIIDAILVQQIPAAAAQAVFSLRDIFGGLVRAAVWIPYTLVSIRVRVTFRY